ncbi:VOC family protein [Colwellia sp. RE-S-Sl-9]
MSRSNLIVLLTFMLNSFTVCSVMAQSYSDKIKDNGSLRIDHIVVAASDLNKGSKQIKDITGVDTVFGGLHPGGTQNSLISLGPQTYLEVLAPQEKNKVPKLAEWLLPFDHATPMRFAVSTKDIKTTKSWLQKHGYHTTDLKPGGRTLPNGDTLMWTSMTIKDPVINGSPFFIQWDKRSPHPAATSPIGCEFHSLMVISSQSDELETLFNILGLEIIVENLDGRNPTMQVLLDCPKGRVQLK